MGTTTRQHTFGRGNFKRPSVHKSKNLQVRFSQVIRFWSMQYFVLSVIHNSPAANSLDLKKLVSFISHVTAPTNNPSSLFPFTKAREFRNRTIRTVPTG